MDGYESFKEKVFKLTKIDLNSYKERQMKRRIESLMEKHEIKTFDEYEVLIRKDKVAFEEFINFLTINVSEFYRNPDQWKMLVEKYLPDIIDRYGKRLKVWSAACSTGDEPYSLVMALSGQIDINHINISATDLDKQVLAKAKVGLYNSKSIIGVPEQYKSKYFTKVGPSYQISDEIKRRVDFKEHNLLMDKYPSNCHIIVCRNVLIYFTEEAKREIYRKFNSSLVEGGLLFIGSTEQVMDYKELGYKRLSSFFYEKSTR